MSKRFTDSEKWKDPWFQELPVKYKLFWYYLLDNCDIAGIWKVNIRLAAFQIGEPFEQSEIMRIFNDRIEDIGDGKWFIKKYISFQYGELSTEARPHKAVIKILEDNKIKGYTKGIDTLKDKYKDKYKYKDKDKEGAANRIYENYKLRIKPGAKNRCIKNLKKHLKSYLEEDLIDSIANYASVMAKEIEFRKDPANFFGSRKEDQYFIEFLPDNFNTEQILDSEKREEYKLPYSVMDD